MTDEQKISVIARWLQAGAPPTRRPEDVLGALCDRLIAAGVPLWRVGVFVQTLHPDFMGRRFLWEQGKGVSVNEAPVEMLTTDFYRHSPIAMVIDTGQAFHRRLCDPACPIDFPIVEELRQDGATDYLVTPMRFVDGAIHGVSWATREPGGFTDAAIEALHVIIAPLTRLAEIWALRRVATNLLDTYVGHQAGARVLAGQIRRGHTEVIRAAIWLSDLRDFTGLSERLAPAEVIEVLNRYFDCQVPPIQDHGGEVLKFMGDGLLAIFPTDGARTPAAACADALAAAHEAAMKLAELKPAAPEGPQTRLRFAVALHFGDVLYGNIGSGNRLDFTCIGPAVNLAARLENVARDLGRSLAASAAFVETCGDGAAGLQPLGAFALRGIEQKQIVYGAEETPAVGAHAG